MRADSRLTAFLTALGAVAVGAAVQVADGYGRPAAFVWLTVAVVAVLLAVVLPTHRTVEAALARALPPILVVALAWQLWAMQQRVPAGPFLLVPEWRTTFLLAAVVVVVAAFAILVGRRIVRNVAVLVLLGTHLALGIWTIRILPQPWPMIDVYMFQRDSVAALLAGVDPYAITFPNPYPTGAYYGPGMVVDGRLTFGFVYPPLSVFLSVLGDVDRRGRPVRAARRDDAGGGVHGVHAARAGSARSRPGSTCSPRGTCSCWSRAGPSRSSCCSSRRRCGARRGTRASPRTCWGCSSP